MPNRLAKWFIPTTVGAEFILLTMLLGCLNASAKTPVDVSALNVTPAGVNCHFVESHTGNRARFLGIVFTGPQCFHLGS